MLTVEKGNRLPGGHAFMCNVTRIEKARNWFRHDIATDLSDLRCLVVEFRAAATEVGHSLFHILFVSSFKFDTETSQRCSGEVRYS